VAPTLSAAWARGAEDLKSGSKKPHHLATPPHIVALILRVRAERQYGPIRICLYLQRFQQVYVSVPTIYKILKRHGVPRVSMKRYRPGPHRRREFTVPGQSVQVDVKHWKLGGRRFYQFTAIDEATRYRVLQISTHNSIPHAIAFLDEVRQRLPMAIPRGQTDNGNEFGTDFTWHLRDLGIAHRHIPPGCPEVNGKVERSHRTDSGRPGSSPRSCGVGNMSTTISGLTSRLPARRRPNASANSRPPSALFRRRLD